MEYVRFEFLHCAMNIAQSHFRFG